MLKQALDPQNWRGRLVHSVISDHILPELAQHQWPDFDSARKHALELLDRQLAFSRAGLYRTTSKTKAGNDYCVLRANLKGEELPISDLEKVRQDVIHALTVLETNYIELLERIRRAKWLLAEADPEKIRSSAIRFKLDDEILIEAIPDLIFCE